MPAIQLKRLRESAVEPTYSHIDDAGFDLYAASEVVIKPNETKLVPLGYAMGIPRGWLISIKPRSGMSLKTGLRVANSPGTIDSGYQNEVNVIMHNTSDERRTIQVGDRVAQGMLERVNKAEFTFVEHFSPSDRGMDGLGSTGV